MANILIVEDEAAIRENLAEIIMIAGHATMQAGDGKSACQLIGNGLVPDLILCDVMMPHMDGYEYLQWVRTHEVLFDVPFVILTARNDSRDMRRGMSLGADDYLIKPFDVSELLQCIEMRLGMSRKRLREQPGDLLSTANP